VKALLIDLALAGIVVSGVGLTVYGIALWSLPAALVIGGLVLALGASYLAALSSNSPDSQ
jgi:hypothetical protein